MTGLCFLMKTSPIDIILKAKRKSVLVKVAKVHFFNKWFRIIGRSNPPNPIFKM